VRIYVGNLSYDTTEDGLRQLFEQHGEVREVHVPTDRETSRPRGFAFVEMADDEAARTAMEALNGSEVGGRTLKVNEARAREDRPRGGGGGGGGGYGGGGGGGGGGGRW
jgi:cold-inducible RNA-binding protein